MSATALKNCFEKWNPMETDYMNTEFNQYVTGPGASLQQELQPAMQAANKGNANNVVPSIVFKDVPKEMTMQALRNMCSRHGKVKEIRNSKKNSFYFVDMATVGDMEAAFRALENNNYGFKVMVGKNKEKTPYDKQRDQCEKIPPIVPPRNTGIDFKNRKYRTSRKNHQRPKIKEDNPFNLNNVAITGLPINLLLNDAHNLERQGLSKQPNNDKFSYRNGRSQINMSEKAKQFLDKKHKQSSGRYVENEDKFIHVDEGYTIPNNIAKCSQCCCPCDTICDRCSQHYCSVECQKKDWPEHRYKCGKPPMSEKAKQFLDKKHKQSSGRYVENEDKFIHVDEGYTIPNNIAKCSQCCCPCDTICDRCSQYYCSVECQKKDWPEHRYKCGKPPHLQKTPSPKKTIQADNNSQSKFKKQINEPNDIGSSTATEGSKKSIPKAFPKQLLSKIGTKQNPSTSNTFPELVYSKAVTTSQHQSTSSTSSCEEFSKISSVSQTRSRNLLKNVKEIYEHNMPRSGNIVNMTAISRSNVVFIRSITYEANLSYINTVDTLQTIGKMLHPLKTLPKSGEVVVTKFEEQFNRALVLSVSTPKKILIHFMDYGNIEEAKFEDLLEAPKELLLKPRHAIPVLLKDVNDVYMTQEIRKFMHAYLNNINLEIRYKPEDFREDTNVYAVELIDETTQQNLNKMIMKLSKPTEPQDADEICDRGYLARKACPGGHNVELIVMDNSLMCSGCISCTIKSYALEIEKFKEDIQAYVKSIPNEAYTPRSDELCIAQYNEDGLWYRGVCLETVGDGHPTIHFFDYGNITMVPIENIRRYPRQFTYPIYTVDCAIEGLPELCDDRIVEQLEQMIPNGETILCENVTVDEENNFCTLSMPNVIRHLTERGLLEYK